MTTMNTIMTVPFVLAPQPMALRGNVIHRIGRRVAQAWNASLTMTAQDRADAYVARMPVAVIAG